MKKFLMSLVAVGALSLALVGCGQTTVVSTPAHPPIVSPSHHTTVVTGGGYGGHTTVVTGGYGGSTTVVHSSGYGGGHTIVQSGGSTTVIHHR